MDRGLRMVGHVTVWLYAPTVTPSGGWRVEHIKSIDKINRGHSASISAHIGLPRQILEISRATLEIYLAKILGSWVNPLTKIPKGQIGSNIQKADAFDQKNNLTVFPC